MKEARRKTKKQTGGEKKSGAKKHILEVKMRKPADPRRSPSHHESSGKVQDPARSGHKAQAVKIVFSAPRQTRWSGVDDSRKSLIMWSGIGFLMIVIIFVWIANMKRIINAGIQESQSDNQGQFSELGSALDQIKQNLSEFDEFKDKLGQLKDYTQTVTTTLPQPTGGEASTTLQDEPIPAPQESYAPPQGQNPAEDIQAAKRKLEQLEDRLENISQTSTSTGQ